MMINKTALMKSIDQTKQNEMIVLTVNSLEKDSLRSVQKDIEKFMNKSYDYLTTIVKR
jgi:hypothetical protein